MIEIMFENAVKSKGNQAEAGNVLIWILIFIVLMAALSFTVSQGSRTSVSGITDEQAKLTATEILDYAGNVKRVVQELQINGCANTEISFENAIVSGYSNPNAPSDNSCHVFHPNGGGLRYVSPTTQSLDSAYDAQSDFGEILFSGAINVANIGSSDEDLIMIIPYIQQNICKSINDKANIAHPIPVDIFTATKFVGTYAASANPGLGDDAALLENQNFFCVQRQASTYYSFGHVLIAR